MPSSKSPNILVFMTDDHGRWASSVYGHRELMTPTMRFLGDGGAVMQTAFTPTPVCSPARASFFTGRTASQHGIHDWISEDGLGRDHPGLDGQTTLAQLLQQGGYHTGLVGKWHCGGGPRRQPGFDRWFSHGDGHQYPHFGDKTYSDQGKGVQLHGHQATILTDQAIQFLRQRPEDQPFFLFCGYVNTHTPHAQQPQRLVSHYRQASFADIPQHERPPAAYWPHPQVNSAMDLEQAREKLAQYYAAVTMIDQQMGRILDELDNLKLTDETLVVYTADHGHMNGQHGLQCKGNTTIPQNFLEESIRVPLLLRWPGHLAPGTSCDAMVDHCDLHATLLEASGVTVEASVRREIHSPGRSFLSMLKHHAADNWRDAQFCEYGNARMIRTGRYKYIQRLPGPNGHFGDELYDLAADPRETVNGIDHPARNACAAELRTRLEAHFAEFQIQGRAGTEAVHQPPFNPTHPWRTKRPVNS